MMLTGSSWVPHLLLKTFSYEQAKATLRNNSLLFLPPIVLMGVTYLVSLNSTGIKMYPGVSCPVQRASFVSVYKRKLQILFRKI